MGKSFENDRPFRPMYNEDFGFEDCSALRVGKYGLEKLFMDQKVWIENSKRCFLPG